MFVGAEARTLSAEVEKKLREALSADTRVSEVYPAQDAFDVDNARTRTLYEFDPEAENLLDSLGSFQGLTLNSTILFRVRIPEKNQPKYRSMDDVPADEYLVAWNGLALAVQWDQSSPRATGSGGHVVLEILESVGESAGYPVVVLVCSPGCLHRFVHADFVTFELLEDPPDHFHVAGETPVGSTVVTPYSREADDQRNLLRTFSRVASPLLNFAEAKASSDVIHYLADSAKRDSAAMLSNSYEWAARRRLPDVRGWISDLWAMRGSRRETRQLIAGIWLALAVIDSHLGPFQRIHAHFLEVLQSRGLAEVQDFLDAGEESISSMNLTGVRASLQETSSRLEGRLLVAATFAGAVAAMGGAAIAALLT